MKNKKNILAIISLVLLILIVVGAAYAYFQVNVGIGNSTNMNVITETTDSLIFETGDPISIEVNQDNFRNGMPNQTGSTYAKAILKSTTDSPFTYNVFLDMKSNRFSYTTREEKPELMLKITDPNGNEITSGIEELTYKSVVDGQGNTINGFDITKLKATNVIKIASNYEIKTTSEIIQNWNIEIILVNLDSDQTANAGASFSAKLVIRQEEHAGAKVLKSVTYNQYTEIWKHRNTITKVIFEDTPIEHDNAQYIYDISSLQDKSIMAYMVNNGDDTYTTYINSLGKITANSNSANLFYNFSKLTTIEGIENIDTSQVTSMANMFYSCSSLTSVDVSHFDTSNVTNMRSMFYICSSITSLDVSHFDTSNVTNMYNLFSKCSKLTNLDLKNFNTSQVTNMSQLFSNCSSLIHLDISSFDTSQVTDMSFMFNNCSSLTNLDISHFDTSQVTNMQSMFSSCRTLTSLDVSHFDTSQVTNMQSMFSSCIGLTSIDVSCFNTAKATDMSGMFLNCRKLTSLDLSLFDTSKVVNIEQVFRECVKLTNLNMSNAEFSNVTKFSNMFYSTLDALAITVKDQAAKDFIEARLKDVSNTGTVTIVGV